MGTTAPPRPESAASLRRDLDVLCEIARELASTLSPREVAERLLHRVRDHLDAEVGAILLFCDDHVLRIAHARGLPPSVVQSTEVRLGEGISGHVAELGRAVLIDDVDAHPVLGRRLHERFHAGSVVAAPLVFRGRLLGVLVVSHSSDRPAYSTDDMRLVEAIAAHASLALFNERRHEEVLVRAGRDALTGLASHGHFHETLDVEVQRALRHGKHLSVALLDVDGFRKLNDLQGHLAADGVLAGIGRLLLGHSRVSDLAARHGGDEFAVLLPETPLAGARVFAEKIRAAVEATGFDAPAAGVVTLSAGIATFPDDATDAAGLARAAERRLLAAKSAGGNRVGAED